MHCLNVVIIGLIPLSPKLVLPVIDPKIYFLHLLPLSFRLTIYNIIIIIIISSFACVYTCALAVCVDSVLLWARGSPFDYSNHENYGQFGFAASTPLSSALWLLLVNITAEL